MLHTRYIADQIPVCEKPTRLDMGEFVVIDKMTDGPEPYCKDCRVLIALANKREYEREAYGAMTLVRNPNRTEEPGDLEKFLTGVLLASAFWVTVFVIFWAVWLR